jgi:phospholipase/carboxylesterase
MTPERRPHVYLPGNTRLMLMLHGTGADEHDLLGLARALDPEAAVLSPRGEVSENGMNRFFERYPDGSFNHESVREAAAELGRFIDWAVEHYGIQFDELVACGFSNGANTAAALMVLHPNRVNRAVLFGSTKPLPEPISADLTKLEVWLANGDRDPYAPVEVSAEWVNELTAAGASVHWLRHPGGHSIDTAHLQQIHSELS